jgi:hypothetical protein
MYGSSRVGFYSSRISKLEIEKQSEESASGLMNAKKPGSGAASISKYCASNGIPGESQWTNNSRLC